MGPAPALHLPITRWRPVSCAIFFPKETNGGPFFNWCSPAPWKGMVISSTAALCHTEDHYGAWTLARASLAAQGWSWAEKGECQPSPAPQTANRKRREQ